MTALSSKFDEALAYASAIHREQKRKSSGAPYIGHLLAVAGTIIEYKGTEDEAIAGLLHDAMEDQAIPKSEIAAKFGDTVANIVEACSDTIITPKPPWKERKLHHIATIEKASPSVLLVTAADKLSNMRSLLDDYRYARLSKVARARFWEPFKGGRDGSMWYYREMASAIGHGCMRDLERSFNILRVLEEYNRAIEDLEELLSKHEHDDPKRTQGSDGTGSGAN